MNIKRIAISLLFCIAFPAWARAQVGQLIPAGVEYGDLSELVGKRRVFVHAESLSTRDKIVKELSKASSPGLEVVGRAEDADFLLVFDAGFAQATQSPYDSFYGGGAEGTVAVSGGLIALKVIGGESLEGRRTRVLWHAHKRQTFVRTEQLFRPTYSNSTRSNLIGLAVGGLLSTLPKLSLIPFGRSPEIKATREFIKDLKKAYARQPEYARTSPYLPPAAGERLLADGSASSAGKGKPQLPGPSVLFPSGQVTFQTRQPLPVTLVRDLVLSPKADGRCARGCAGRRRRGVRVKKNSRVTRTSKARRLTP